MAKAAEMVAENTARLIGGGGRYLTKSFSSITESKRNQKTIDAHAEAMERLKRMGVNVEVAK